MAIMLPEGLINEKSERPQNQTRHLPYNTQFLKELLYIKKKNPDEHVPNDNNWNGFEQFPFYSTREHADLVFRKKRDKSDNF